jgi:hypothetical protein
MKFSPDNNGEIKNTIQYFFLFALLVLLVLIAISPSTIVADERFFLPNLKVYQQYGLTFDFLRNMRDQSPGPLYQAIYTPLTHLFPLTPKVLRFLNYIFVVLDIYLLYRLLISENVKNAFGVSLLFMAIPMAWDVAGMAFTEMPAIFCCLAALIMLRRSLLGTDKYSILLAIAAGLTAGAAIMGRSPFLMVVPSAFLLFKIPGKRIEVVLFMISTMIFPSIVFYVWKGLVPADVQGIQAGYNFFYIFLCLNYFAVSAFIVYPDMFRIGKQHYYIAIAVLVIAFILNMFVFRISYMPMNGALPPKSVPKFFAPIYPYIFEAFSTAVSYIFAVALFKHAHKNQDLFKWFYLAFCLFIAFTTVKSAAHFSSRYIMQAYPIFLLYIGHQIKFNRNLLWRCIAGCIIGIISLESYYIIWTQYHIHFQIG